MMKNSTLIQESPSIQSKKLFIDGELLTLKLFEGNLYEIEFENGKKLSLIEPNIDFRLDEQKEEFLNESRYDFVMEILNNLIERNITPVFTVPREYLDSVNENGLVPKITWLKDFILAGTIGIDFYNPGKDRILCILKPDFDLRSLNLKPRLTGKDKIFQGVIATENPIARADLIVLDSQTFEPIQTNSSTAKNVVNIQEHLQKKLINTLEK